MQELTAAGEIREGYGRQCIPQIISSLEQNPDILCIHALTSLLSTQELKAQAIRQGAPALLVGCLRPNSAEMTKSACKCLTKITRHKSGWQAVIDNHGIEALVSVLLDAPVEASETLQQISQTLEGSRAILARKQDVLMQLAKSCQVCRQLGWSQCRSLCRALGNALWPQVHQCFAALNSWDPGLLHFCRS
jgi:hypothetical protein